MEFLNGATIEISGSIFSTKTDAEGYSKITLEIPSSDLAKVVSLLALVQTPLHITFRKLGGKG